ncbi:MAG: chitobiase/beta-hexosaminidase C-terminal domain-containing protein, partial [Pedobacter sp.]
SDGSGGSGCAATYYCLGTGCTPTTLYSGPVNVSASTDIRFFSTDNRGNSETAQTSTFTIASGAAPVPALDKIGIIAAAIGMFSLIRRRRYHTD